jgi:hypothetical protein
MATTIEKSVCPCGIAYEFEKRHGDFWKDFEQDPGECGECAARREKEEEENRQKVLREKYREAAFACSDRLMPARMCETDFKHEDFNQKLWEAVSAWSPTSAKPWLGLIGPTGKCKTRCSYLCVEQALLDFDCTSGFRTFKGEFRPGCVTDWKVFAVSATEFAAAVRNQFSDDKELAKRSREVIVKAHEAWWLILDDLGKCTHSPAVASGFFGLLDERHNRNAVTIWTANSTPQEFLSNIPKDIADPLRGRLLECSEIIIVK